MDLVVRSLFLIDILDLNDAIFFFFFDSLVLCCSSEPVGTDRLLREQEFLAVQEADAAQ